MTTLYQTLRIVAEAPKAEITFRLQTLYIEDQNRDIRVVKASVVGNLAAYLHSDGLHTVRYLPSGVDLMAFKSPVSAIWAIALLLRMAVDVERMIDDAEYCDTVRSILDDLRAPFDSIEALDLLH